MAISRKLIAAVLTVVGAAVLCAGIALIYVPAALIVGGGGVAAFAYLELGVEDE